MNNKLLLLKCIVLLYRESQLIHKEEMSHDLVRTMLDTISSPEITVSYLDEKDAVQTLKSTAFEMVEAGTDAEYDKNTLLQQLKLNCQHDEKLFETFQDSIQPELSESQLKRTIISHRKALHNYHRETQITELVNKAAYQFKYNRNKIKNVNEFISGLVLQLESLAVTTNLKDPAITSEIDIGDEKSTSDLFNNVKQASNGDRVFRTGWQWFNDMFHGGIRRGEQVLINALPHNYKSGFTLSLFKQIALYNKPHMIDPNKKPLLLRISFEDDLELNVKFLYQSLKFDEGIIEDDISNISSDAMAHYVKQRLQVNGFQIKMLRVDPTQWTYKHIINKVIEYEAQGYEIQLLMVDYLGMLPTTGCIQGPAGTDMRDLFRRIKNFCSSKKITNITPHQLSTDAKILMRGNTAPHHFVKECRGKGYYAGSKQIDQEIDLEVYIHIVEHHDKYYLTCGWGKHRGFVTPESKKYVLLPFPAGEMPIPDDVNHDHPSHLTKLPIASNNDGKESSLFSFG